MIISDSEKFIFIHNPKCAGTTVRRSLMKHETRSNRYWMFADLDGRKIDAAHMPLFVFKRFSEHDYKLLQSYFVFGFVRNPLSRCLSAYNEIHKKQYQEMATGQISLDEYASAVNAFILKIRPHEVYGHNLRYRHFTLQTNMFFDGSKRMADLILKTEEMAKAESMLGQFSKELEACASTWNDKKNVKNLDHHYTQVFTDQTTSHIASVYEKDFVNFDYPDK